MLLVTSSIWLNIVAVEPNVIANQVNKVLLVLGTTRGLPINATILVVFLDLKYSESEFWP